MKYNKWLPLLLSGVVMTGCMSLEDRLQSNDPEVKRQAEYELVRTSRGAQRITAIQRLTDEQVLAAVAISAEGHFEKEGVLAVGKMKTDSGLANVVAHAKSPAVAKVALDGIKDRKMLVDVALSTQSPSVFDMVIGKCDQQGVLQIATKHQNVIMRSKAIEKIENEETRNELKAKVSTQVSEMRKKQSKVATATILKQIKVVVRGRNGMRDDARNNALTMKLKNDLRQVTELSDLEKIAQECNAWRGWDSGDDTDRGQKFDEDYLPERFTEVCKDPKDVIKFMTEGFWNIRPNEKQRTRLLSSIKDEAVYLELAAKSTSEIQTQVWNGMSDEMFVKFALQMPHEDAHHNSIKLSDRIEKIKDEKLLVQLLAKSKSGFVRDKALRRINSADSLFEAACTFDFNFDSSHTYVESSLLKKIEDVRLIDVLRKNPKFMSFALWEVRNADVAKHLLHNADFGSLLDKESAGKRLIEILKMVDKAEFEKCVNLAKQRAVQQQEAGTLVFGNFYLGMPVLDYAVLLMQVDGLQKYWYFDAADDYKVKGWQANWKVDRVKLPRIARYKILKLEEDLKGLDQFVCTYIKHIKPAPEGTFAKAAQQLKNYQDYHLESNDGDLYWTYKDLKTMTAVDLYKESGDLVVIKIK